MRGLNYFLIIKYLPFLSGFYNNPPTCSDLFEALKETICIVLFSWVPIMITIFFTYASVKADQQLPSFGDVLKANIGYGEIPLFTIALIGPVLFVLYRYLKEKEQFTNAWAFLLSMVSIIIYGGASYTAYKLGIVVNPAANHLFFNTNLYVYIFALLLMYISLAYSNVLTLSEIDKKIKEATKIMESHESENRIEKDLKDFAGGKK